MKRSISQALRAPSTLTWISCSAIAIAACVATSAAQAQTTTARRFFSVRSGTLYALLPETSTPPLAPGESAPPLPACTDAAWNSQQVSVRVVVNSNQPAAQVLLSQLPRSAGSSAMVLNNSRAALRGYVDGSHPDLNCQAQTPSGPTSGGVILDGTVQILRDSATPGHYSLLRSSLAQFARVVELPPTTGAATPAQNQIRVELLTLATGVSMGEFYALSPYSQPTADTSFNVTLASGTTPPQSGTLIQLVGLHGPGRAQNPAPESFALPRERILIRTIPANLTGLPAAWSVRNDQFSSGHAFSEWYVLGTRSDS